MVRNWTNAKYDFEGYLDYDLPDELKSNGECRCVGCNKKPEEIGEYIQLAKEMNCTPEEAVVKEEGTYNWITKKFYCTSCYIKAGMPLGKA